MYCVNIDYFILTAEQRQFYCPIGKDGLGIVGRICFHIRSKHMGTFHLRQPQGNYINPIIGDMKLDSLTPRTMDRYYRDLLSVKLKLRPYQFTRNEFLSPWTVKEIQKLLRNAFNQAVKWELMSRNPVAHATLPKSEAKPRDIWTADTLFHAIELCDDDLLELVLNLAFSCSLRMGRCWP